MYWDYSYSREYFREHIPDFFFIFARVGTLNNFYCQETWPQELRRLADPYEESQDQFLAGCVQTRRFGARCLLLHQMPASAVQFELAIFPGKGELLG